MEGWIKIGVQRASVLYPNSCYNEVCYIEVQVYCELLTLIDINLGLIPSPIRLGLHGVKDLPVRLTVDSIENKINSAETLNGGYHQE